jgi:streptogramin lyase
MDCRRARRRLSGSGYNPTDWTVGIQYTAASTLLPQQQNIAADASGNIWVVTNGSSANGSLVELSPTGVPMLSSNLTSGAVSLTSVNPRNIAIDTNGNVWIPTSSVSGTLFEYTAGGTINTLNLGKASYGIAIDASGNLWVSNSVGANTVTAFVGWLRR